MGRADNNHFIEIVEMVEDQSTSDRRLSTARIGDVYMILYVINPGTVVPAHYHEHTRNMFYVEKGEVRIRCEHIETKERKEIRVRPYEDVVHIPEYVAHEFRNEGDEPALLVFLSSEKPRGGDKVEYDL